MRKIVILLIFIISQYSLLGQEKGPEYYGFRHFRLFYKGEIVEVLIKSKKGEEQIKKPLFLFCQGSLPIPLIITYNDKGRESIYSVFPFNPDILCSKYHLVIISKPFVPLIASRDSLADDLTYRDIKGQFPVEYSNRNLLDYYVKRNEFVINFLRKQSWVSHSKLVIAGHSEGSTIAAKLCSVTPSATALIYSGGNPFGRIMTIIARSRQKEREVDSTSIAEKDIEYWNYIVANANGMKTDTGDTPRTTYEFSIPPIHYLEKVKIPVLITYGTRDAGAIFNDYLRVEVIRKKKRNFTFKEYLGTEHNYFLLERDGSINYKIFNWDKVADDWLSWLNNN
ncbi:hypothetical protein ACDQ55_20935 [Chitinophaga sp. 30R24]|uniref:hypothetical protein n=1 Tax=Chitinophaga sp. 30R24 TaxID=3248838 RepID=UPI003B90BFD7